MRKIAIVALVSALYVAAPVEKAHAAHIHIVGNQAVLTDTATTDFGAANAFFIPSASDYSYTGYRSFDRNAFRDRLQARLDRLRERIRRKIEKLREKLGQDPVSP